MLSAEIRQTGVILLGEAKVSSLPTGRDFDDEEIDDGHG